ncbi:3'-5' exonuclease [Candidatus Falkowbacteria bacterium]|nr:3'-5' exonuclease [Candidatus Falkowbacteria bacterium]
MENINTTPFIVFDIETTGLEYRMGNQVIEIAAQKIIDNQVIDEYYALINPTVPVEDGAYSTHGLSNLYLAQNGKSGLESLSPFIDFTRDGILVGHNILTFDIPFLNNDLKRLGLQALSNPVVDTLIMARKLLPQLPNHKLGTVATHFGVDPSGAHRAMVDVEMNKKVFLMMLSRYLDTLKQEQKILTSQASGKLL